MSKLVAIDCEFLDAPNTIELISIALVTSTGKEYYAVSLDFNPDHLTDWLKENVWPELPSRTSGLWKHNDAIRDDIINFLGSDKIIWITSSGAYDHVVLAKLWPSMVDWPKNYSYWDLDVKAYQYLMGNPEFPAQTSTEHDALNDARETMRRFQFLQQVRMAYGGTLA